LDGYMRSNHSNDWFTIKHCPSEEECAECGNIVLKNLLSMSSFCFLWGGIADILLAHSKTSTWSHCYLLNVWWHVKYIAKFLCYWTYGSLHTLCNVPSYLHF
jgi:hypothetical protein